MTKKESPITLVVRRGAFRRFHKLQKDTANLPVVVMWDRREDDRIDDPEGLPGGSPEERRRQPSFTWDLADFIVVPSSGESVEDETGGEAAIDADALTGGDEVATGTAGFVEDVPPRRKQEA